MLVAFGYLFPIYMGYGGIFADRAVIRINTVNVDFWIIFVCVHFWFQSRLYALNQIRELLSAEKDKESIGQELSVRTLTTLNYPAHLLLLAGSFCLGINSRENGSSRAQPTHYTVSIWAASWQNQQNDCAPSKDSDQPGHPPSLIRVFAVHSVGSLGPKVSSCGLRRLWSDWADAQAEMSLCWAHMPFRWFWCETAHLWV